MGLISPGGENLLDFLELVQVISSYDGALRDPLWCELILGLKFEGVQGKQVSLEWTETSGGLRERWHDPGVPLAFPVESAST